MISPDGVLAIVGLALLAFGLALRRRMWRYWSFCLIFGGSCLFVSNGINGCIYWMSGASEPLYDYSEMVLLPLWLLLGFIGLVEVLGRWRKHDQKK